MIFFFSFPVKKNKQAIGASYEIICIFNFISNNRYEGCVFYNADSTLQLHTSFPQECIPATNSTLGLPYDRFKSEAEYNLCATFFFI